MKKFFEIFDNDDIEAQTLDPSGRSLLNNSILEGYSEISDYLISLNHQLEVPDKKGWSPLHYCAYKDNVSVAESLLAKGVEIDKQDNFGNTPLWRAVFEGSKKMAAYLFTKGADAMIKNNYGVCAFDLAIEFEDEFLKSLISK